MRCVVLAYSNIGCAGIEALVKNGFEVAAVFTHPDKSTENIWFRSAAETAVANNIPVFAPEDINHPIWVERIKELKPDFIFSFYYRELVGKEILSIPSKGCMNLHGSLLPAYRGRCPINWVLVNGETETGVTLHYMTEKPDAGDIVAQKKVAITEDDTALSLHKKCTEAATALLNETLPKIKEGTASKTAQDNSKSSYFGGRTPEDGEICWEKSATEVRNLVRAVTTPFPGAYSYIGDRKILIWQTAIENKISKKDARPGDIISREPLVVACGVGAVKITAGQKEGGVYMSGEQLSREMNLVAGMKFGAKASLAIQAKRKKRVLILGVNGFIGNFLVERLLQSGKYEVHGMDLQCNNIKSLIGRPGFHFEEGDISIHREWIEYHVRKCDIVLPLVAIATPIEYTRNPLRVFELDFEENLRVVRYCAKYGKRIIFPSTSEVYGMCEDEEFDENNSKLILGPIRMQRWIYSCSKQMLDRVIYALGTQHGLKFTLFRPFNWIGPKLDSLNSARIGSSRAITQLILNLVEGTPIQLIDGGEQKRCFTDVSEGIECLYRIIDNPEGICNSEIFNIGNPWNEASIKDLAMMLVEKFDKHPLRSKFPPFAGFQEIESKSYYGKGYQDVQHRKPSIKNAQKLLDWTPVIGFEQSVENTLDYFLKQAIESGDFRLED